MDVAGASGIVTGGASGLGAATARRLAEAGARVVIVDLQDGDALAQQLDGAFVRADVTVEAEVAAAVDAASEMGPLRALVNCAGIGPPNRTINRDGTPHDLALFEKVVAINLVGSFNCIRLAAAAMAQTDPTDGGDRGAIVNTASVAAYDGQVGQAAYSASKGGIVGMTLPIARDLSAVGIRVNTIAPGLIDTPIYGEGEQSDAFKAHLGQSVLFPKRLGSGEELAFAVMECITNPYMNGETIRVDGGIRMPPR